MTLIEAIAVALGLINITLIIRRSIWNYPFGIAMVMLYAHIFWSAKLYSDAGLQLFFFAVQFYGWWSWAQRQQEDGSIAVDQMTNAARAACVLGSVVAIALWGGLMSRLTDASYPYWDGAIAMLSVVAQIMMVRRLVESWWWWIVVDALAIDLFAVKGLWLTAGLYAVFLAMAVVGLIQWQKRVRAI